jgi:class 3 adenylate cyclase/predicted ATPase
MDAIAGSGIFLFEGFRLDWRGGGLFRTDGNGFFVPVAIGSRALDVLCVLVERHGDLVPKAEIMTAAWPGTVVADSNLPIQILALRRILDQGRAEGSCIQTVAGRGYRFVASVTHASGHKLAYPTDAIEAPTAPAGRSSLAELRPITALSATILGFPLSANELDPEDLLDTTAALHCALADIVSRARGIAASLHGDALFAYFGYPAAHEDDAERAVRVGLTLLDAIGRFEAPNRLRARIGIATGPVIVGDVCEGGRQTPSVVGAAPSLATRLQALAAPNTIVIAESTQRQVGAFFELEDLGAFETGDASQRIWRVKGERRGLGRFEALRSGDTPLVGREEEIALLCRLWTRAKAGEGNMVLLSGEPGVGKSRLAAALEKRLREEQYLELRYFCSPYHQNSALYPVIAQLERAAAFEREDTPELKLEKLEALLALAPLVSVEEDIALLADLLSLPLPARYPPLDFTPQLKREKVLCACARHIEALARRQPILIVFEDLQWIDPTSRDLLQLIIERLEGRPVLLIATFRPEFQPPWIGQPQVTALSLSRLNRRSAEALVHGLAGAAVPSDVADAIVERGDGVPLFLEELTKAVLEETVQVAGPAVPVQALVVPATLHALLLARLDRLGAGAKEMAQIGAAIGRQFSFELLAAVAGQDVSRLEAPITRLVEAGLVFQRGTTPQASFLFKHALVQEAAYATLLRAPRQLLHARIADALHAEDGKKIVAAPEIIAHHLESAGRSVEAVTFWREAGERAVRRAANREGIEHFRRGLSLLEAQPDSAERLRVELAILSQLGPALMSVYGWSAPEAGEMVERAANIGRQLESTADLAPSIANLAVFNIYRCQLDKAEEASADLFRIARELDDAEIMLQAHHCAWPVRYHRGRFAQALEHADAGLNLYEEERHSRHRHVYFGHDPAVCALALGAAAQWVLGYPASAMHRHAEAITLARRLRDPASLAHSLFISANSHAADGDAAGVFTTATELRELSDRHGFSHFHAYALMFLGWALACSGEVAQGIRQITYGFGILRQQGARNSMPRGHCLMAEAHLMANHHREGLEHVTQALELAQTGDQGCLARLHHLHAELLLHFSGSDDEAVEASLLQAISVARRQGAKGWELPAATSLARLWLDRGRQGEARALVAPIYGWFSEGFGTPALLDARRLLDTLA